MTTGNDSSHGGDYNMPDPAKAYAKAGAAFQGASWLHAPEYKQSDEVRLAAADMLAKQKPAHEEGTLTTHDLAAIKEAVMRKCRANGVPDAEIQKIVAYIDSNVGALKSSLEDIRKQAYSDAAEAVAQATGEVTDKLQSIAEMRLEEKMIKVAELGNDIEKDLSKSMTKAEQEQEKEFERRLANAKTDEERLKIEEERNQFHEKVVTRLEHGTPDEQKVAAQAKPKIDDQKTQIKDARTAYNEVKKDKNTQQEAEIDAPKTKAQAEETEKMADASQKPKVDMNFTGFENTPPAATPTKVADAGTSTRGVS